MPLIQNPGPTQRIRGYYRADDARIETISPELVPVAIVDDLRGISASDPAYERPYGFGDVIAASAGVTSGGSIINPPNSGVVATIERIWMQGAGTWFVTLGSTTSSAGSTPGKRDPRVTSPACNWLMEHSLAGGTRVWEMLLGSDPFVLDLPFVLTPGTQLRCWNTTNNLTVYLAMMFNERSLLYLPTV